MDELIVLPYDGVDTLYKALYKRVNDKNLRNFQFLGTKVGKKYEWMTVTETAQEAEWFAAGAVKLNLMQEVEAEGKIWKFIGIQAKNRKEWNLIHLANMHNGTTTVGLYDTLGEEASKYIIDQTEMITIACT